MSKIKQLLDKKKFLVVVSLPKNDPALARAAFDAGAHAVKVHTNVTHKASGTFFGSWKEERAVISRIIKNAKGPVGIMPGSAIVPSLDEMKEASDLGIDFLDIYDFDMPAWMLKLNMGKMVAAGHEFTIKRVQALEKLGMDFLEASVVPSELYRTTLKVKDLENYSLLASAVKKPVLVPTQKKIEPSEITLLKKTGVKGLVLGTIAIGATPESFAERIPLFLDAAK